ncbi:hypothetical protein CNECB9_4500002 [Cupriavidus necator]|uniref:Uncharacterized protein n=1 Tax=Cupriavidus necator TaxID=106590 RepID=A0A1K0JGF7_CUPNE|nr:hypothetical protein CNECB9_4500002 [Cupriavidus necator]
MSEVTMGSPTKLRHNLPFFRHKPFAAPLFDQMHIG